MTRPLLALPLLLAAAASSALAQRADSSAYLVVRGVDTVQAEWIVRSGDRLRVVVVGRAAAPEVLEHHVLLGSGAMIDLMQVFSVAGGERAATRTLRTTIHASGDSTIEERAGGAPPRLATAGRAHIYNSGGTGPFVYSLLPLLAELAPATVGDSVLGQHVAGTLGARSYVIRRDAPDRVSLGSRRTGMMRVRTDDRGRVVEIDAMASSFNVVAHPAPWLDRDSVVRWFAAMERERPLGATAPRDSAVAVMGDARIVIDYGRPSARGRTIFGGIVPWDQVWRTGANLATHLTTTHALDFGSAVLPPGRYTLWTVPTREGWTLIVNGETGQWGTDYEAAHDVARLRMEQRALGEFVERLTISVELAGTAGLIRLQWETTEATASFVVRPPASTAPRDGEPQGRMARIDTPPARCRYR